MKTTLTVAALEAKLITLLQARTITDQGQLIEAFEALNSDEHSLLIHLQQTLGVQEFTLWLAGVVERAGKVEELAKASPEGLRKKHEEAEAELARIQRKLKKILTLQAELAALDEPELVEHVPAVNIHTRNSSRN